MPLNILHIPEIKSWVKLGCSDQEKTYRQLVSIEIKIIFLNKILAGLLSDKLDDVFCYFKLVNHIKTKIESLEFNLLEYLTGCIYAVVYHDLISAGFDDDIELEITVNKLHPPVLDISKGVKFTYKNKISKEKNGKKDDLYQHWF